MGFKQHISRTWQMIEQQVNDVPFRPHDEAIRLTDSPQTRMKPGFVRNQVYYSYNNFTTNENPWMKRHGAAGTLAVPFCYHDMELNKNERGFP